MEEVNKVFKEFWKELVTNEDGSLNSEAVKNELYDYKCMMDEVSKVYYDLTGGFFSKPNTIAPHVIEAAERQNRINLYQGLDDLVKDEEITEDTAIIIKEYFS